MHRFEQFVFAFCAIACFAGCAGQVNNSLPTLAGASAQRSGLPALPSFTAASLANAPHVAWRSADTSRLPAASVLTRSLLSAIAGEGATSAGHPKRASSAGAGDSESVGVVINSGGPYTGIVGFESAYTPFTVPQTGTVPQIQIGYPAGASGTSLLLAPLLRPSNGSCLSAGMLSDSSGVSTAAYFVALDFCTDKFDFAMALSDSSSVQQYIGNVNGVPGFYTLTLTLDKVPTSTSTWYLLIYNFALSRFDVVTSKVGLSSNTKGLSVFHSTFVAGQCPITPPLAASGLQLYNATSGKFETLKPTMTGTTNVVLPVRPADSCFNADMTGPASFTFSVLNANSSWQVNPQVPATSISEFSTGLLINNWPFGITAGPDGNLWFTEGHANRIGRITPSGTVTEFSSGISASSYPEGITAGPDGNLWFAEPSGNRIARITPSGAVTEFSSGISARSFLSGITAGPDGNLWFTEGVARIGRITTSGDVTEFSSGIISPGEPEGIAAGPDGNLWFTDYYGRIGRITPSGTVTEFSSGISLDAIPEGITAGPDGNLWFAEAGADKIGRITTSGTVTEFSVTSGSSPSGITAGPDGNLWFTEYSGPQIGRITTTGTVTEFSSGISVSSGPYAITAGSDGNLWFTEDIGNRIGRVVP